MGEREAFLCPIIEIQTEINDLLGITYNLATKM